jgi:hypothetical protein
VSGAEADIEIARFDIREGRRGTAELQHMGIEAPSPTYVLDHAFDLILGEGAFAAR